MRIIDLFSGAGGLTFGFYYRIKNNAFVRNRKNSFVFANEFDCHAANAFSKNYPDINMLNSDITDLSNEKITELTNNEPVDLIIGGPPCQSFSTVGQRRFDSKARLYEQYLRIIGIVQPRMFLFENVKGFLSMTEVEYKRDAEGRIMYSYEREDGSTRKRKKPVVNKTGRKIVDVVEETVSDMGNGLGYTLHISTLNSVDYGVPESRERVFIIGIRKDAGLNWEFPKKLEMDPLSVFDAISDLPPVGEGQSVTQYIQAPQNNYQALMRGTCNNLSYHYCGTYSDKIRTVIEHVGQGQGKDDFNRLVDQGIVADTFRLESGYSNTYGRLIQNRPCTTITNNMTVPSALRCIHYEQNRALTPREGARIQSFPDWFQFDGEKKHVSSQIGNAVPPLLAITIAKQIEKAFKGEI